MLCTSGYVLCTCLVLPLCTQGYLVRSRQETDLEDIEMDNLDHLSFLPILLNSLRDCLIRHTLLPRLMAPGTDAELGTAAGTEVEMGLIMGFRRSSSWKTDSSVVHPTPAHPNFPRRCRNPHFETIMNQNTNRTQTRRQREESENADAVDGSPHRRVDIFNPETGFCI